MSATCQIHYQVMWTLDHQLCGSGGTVILWSESYIADEGVVDGVMQWGGTVVSLYRCCSAAASFYFYQ